MAIQKIKGGRVNNVIADDHIGDKGSLFYNEDLGDLRLSDGITKGGIPLTVGQSGDSAPALLSSTAPPVGRSGSMWYDTSTSTLNISQNGAWEPIAAPDDDLAIGHGLKLDQNKVLAVDVNAIISPATTTSLGHVIVGDGLAVDSFGKISVDIEAYHLPQATTTSIGGVTIGDGLVVDANGKLSVNIQSYQLPQATTSSLGGVIIGDGLSVDSTGTISVDVRADNIPLASATTVGGIKLGDGLEMDSNGVVSAVFYVNHDGGSVSSIYGGVIPLDGGGI
jgi:hypothetical protein